MGTLHHFLLLFHILAAIIWIGGMLFYILIGIPVIKDEVFSEVKSRFLMRTGIRFRNVSWICFLIIILTGIANMYFKGVKWENILEAEFWNSPFGSAMMQKLILFDFVLILSTIHDFYMGPKSLTTRDENKKTTFVFFARWIGRINFAIALGILWIAIEVARGF